MFSRLLESLPPQVWAAGSSSEVEVTIVRHRQPLLQLAVLQDGALKSCR